MVAGGHHRREHAGGRRERRRYRTRIAGGVAQGETKPRIAGRPLRASGGPEHRPEPAPFVPTQFEQPRTAYAACSGSVTSPQGDGGPAAHGGAFPAECRRPERAPTLTVTRHHVMQQGHAAEVETVGRRGRIGRIGRTRRAGRRQYRTTDRRPTRTGHQDRRDH